MPLDNSPAEPVVLSALATEEFTPPDSPRTYVLQPLTYRQRTALRRDLRREGGVAPDRAVLLAGMREALQQLAPANLAECLAVIDTAEAAPDDARAQASLALVEQAIIDVPAYASLNDAQARFNEAVPWVAARHCLRGWSGPDLPAFARVDGLVPEALLDAVPASDVASLGWRAYFLGMLGRRAEGNSEGRSPSPDPLTVTPEG